MTEKKIILIVDDKKENRDDLKMNWENDPGYEIFEAIDREEAIEILEREEEIHLILLNLMLQDGQGLSFLEELKGDSDLKQIPVIVNIQQGESGQEEKALEAGADDCILKPYHVGVVKKRVENTIQRNLYEKGCRDQLTGIYTEDPFYYQTRKMLMKNVSGKYAMMFLNITRFKVVNELYGINVGNLILIHIADVLREIVGKEGTFSRMMADHFACCVKRERGGDEIRFYETLAKKIRPLEKEYHFDLECGIYLISDLELPVSIMCDRAKFALTDNHGNYAKKYAYYSESIAKKYRDEQRMVADMEKALNERQFFVMLQPVYDAATGKPVSAEALVRWKHPEMGLIPPSDFIPLFEKNGFIRSLDRFVWEEVCRLLTDLKSRGDIVQPVSVNVSRMDLYDPGLADELESLLDKYQLSRRLLKLEITETAYTENPREIIELVTGLRKKGFELLMDDFGSGYSSLNMLKELPVNILKIDMRFMDNLEFSKRAGNIIISIVRMAKLLKIGTVAEGVETKEQMEFLKNVGCEKIQGYYFSKPLSMDAYKQLTLEQPFRFEDIVPHKRGILIVDDITTVRMALKKALGNTYQYYEASNGKEALEILKQSAGNINIVVTDVYMPEMDGFELIDTLQCDSIFSHIPIVVVTASEGREDEIKALRLGAVDVIIKPYDPVIVSHRIRNVMKISEVEWLQMEVELLNERSKDEAY